MSPDRPVPGPGGLLLLGACFVLSGAASLMDQVVWLRYLTLSFGNTTLATATLLAVFMGGLGMGALLFGRWADRWRLPLAAYAAVEASVAVFALLSPRALGSIDSAYVALYRGWGSHPALFAGGRLVLAAIILLPPTVLMGATLPLVLRAVSRRPERVGRMSSLFYGVNTLGAVLGTAGAGFVAIPFLGLYGTLVIAAACNLLAALGAITLSRPLTANRREPAESTSRETAPRGGLLALFFVMGATSLAFEVLWTRILVFYLGSSVYAYSLMLVLVLLGIGAGSLVASPWSDRLVRVLPALALVELGIGLTVLLQLALFPHLNALLLTLAEATLPTTFRGVVGIQLLALLPLLGPPTWLMGVSFPLAVRALNRDLGELGTDVGAVYGLNTLGAVAGALAAGFVLVPLFGTQDSLVLVGTVNALLGALLLARSRTPRKWAGWVVPACVLAAIPLFPPDRAILSAGMFRHDRPEDLLYFREDAQASVTIRRLPSPAGSFLSLELNGVNVAGTSADLWAIQKMQGHLPLLLARDPRRVVHIGFGSGGTAWAVSRHPVTDILVVEISPEVIRASDRFFRSVNHGVLGDPRVDVEINDGRNFLLATPRTFDAVLSDSIHPRYAGNGSLYTLEYFRLVRERLAPGGVASMWLPMYSLTPRNYGMILEAFREVFPHVAVWYEASAVNSFTIVTGQLGESGWDDATLRRAFADPRVAGELADLGIRDPADLLTCYLAGDRDLDPWLDRLPPHVDDQPAVEYESGALLDRDWTWAATFAKLLDLRPDQPPAAFLDALPEGEQKQAVARYRAQTKVLRSHLAAIRHELQARARSAPEPAAGELPPPVSPD